MPEPEQPRSRRETPRIVKIGGVEVNVHYDEDSGDWRFDSGDPKIAGVGKTLDEATANATAVVESMREPEPTQKTEKGLPIPIPKRGEFYGNLEKSAKARRKGP